jgi:redox-sensitive bicupin YhaK (pirin superfamily)
VEVTGTRFEAGRTPVFRPGDVLAIRAVAPARPMPPGAAETGGSRHEWRNGVASSRERIEAAKGAWQAGDRAHDRLRLPPGGNGGRIAPPER